MICVDVGCGCGPVGTVGLGFTYRTPTASGTTTPDVVYRRSSHEGGETLWDAGAGFLSVGLSGSGTGCSFRMLVATGITTPDVQKPPGL